MYLRNAVVVAHGTNPPDQPVAHNCPKGQLSSGLLRKTLAGTQIPLRHPSLLAVAFVASFQPFPIVLKSLLRSALSRFPYSVSSVTKDLNRVLFHSTRELAQHLTRSTCPRPSSVTSAGTSCATSISSNSSGKCGQSTLMVCLRMRCSASHGPFAVSIGLQSHPTHKLINRFTRVSLEVQDGDFTQRGHGI